MGMGWMSNDERDMAELSRMLGMTIEELLDTSQGVGVS
jgi:hypothetical protein